MSKNFDMKEFVDRRTGEVKVNPSLLERLEALRAELGNVPVIINSGFRSMSSNREVAGAEDSQHLFGNAADISVPGKTPQEIADAAIKVGFTGIGIYPNHVHVDVRSGAKVTWKGRY